MMLLLYTGCFTLMEVKFLKLFYTIMRLSTVLFPKCRNFGYITAMTLPVATFASTTKALSHHSKNTFSVAYVKCPFSYGQTHIVHC